MTRQISKPELRELFKDWLAKQPNETHTTVDMSDK